MSRPLVVAAHGTASLEGQAVVRGCATRALQELGMPGPPTVGFVDVCGPTLDEVLAEVDAPVVVPLFLASGYHVRHDVPTAVEAVAGATVTPALGAADEVVRALTDRVRDAWAVRGEESPEALLVIGAGSSVDGARAEVAEVAEGVAAALSAVPTTAFLSGPGPRPTDELARLREAGHTRVAVAAHLLSPGYFLDQAHAVALAAGCAPTEPLGTHDLVSALVARRYREAVSAS
ncbi:sirohydrochlorin chelatase [Serinicoccus kebangsaanensis]|uniref:sirohydrochlorin chelatase n=1 Tax=Serinicoccus kebangsaanensis TaxID=2602069 RepID=UPI00178C41BA|nr:CbiX/SirB N-terminal domain-containing protein [Serinicoccus kebangsaanensis]